MPYEDKPGDGSIFKNKKKEPGDKRPEYDGSFLDPVTGEKRRIALWIRESKSGNKFFSVKVQVAEEKKIEPKQEQPVATRTNPVDSDIPF